MIVSILLASKFNLKLEYDSYSSFFKMIAQSFIISSDA